MKFVVTAQHMLTSVRIKRVIEAASPAQAEAIAIRELATSDWYPISSTPA